MKKGFLVLLSVFFSVLSCGPDARPPVAPEKTESLPEIVAVRVDANPFGAMLEAVLEREVSAADYSFVVDGMGEFPATHSGLSFRADIEGLVPESRYSFFALVRAGWQAVASDKQEFYTPQVPLPAVGVPSQTPSYFWARLTATVDLPAYPADYTYGFCLAGADGKWRTQESQPEQGSMSCVFEDLQPGHDYRCYAFVRLGSQERVSETVSFQTPEYHYDEVFLAYLLQWFDINADGVISEDEAKRITILEPSCMGIHSLAGIERFTNLESLYASRNEISSIDLSMNKKLRLLEINENPLGTLDVSANLQLVKLSAQGCQLTSLDISKNTALETLHVGVNALESLDVSMLPQLKSLYVSNNSLTELDLSNNPLLWEILCDGNPGLKTIWLREEQLNTIRVFRRDPFTVIKYK